MRKTISIILMIGVLSSCVSLTRSEKRKLGELKAYGITLNNPGPDFEPPKSAGAAGSLNLILGFGNFYLNQGGIGVINLLTWPISILWGIPQAISDAHTINEQAMVDFYMFDPLGKKYLKTLKKEADVEDEDEGVSYKRSSSKNQDEKVDEYEEYEDYE